MVPADGNRAMLVGMTTSNDGDVSGYHGSNDGWVVRVGERLYTQRLVRQ